MQAYMRNFITCQTIFYDALWPVSAPTLGHCSRHLVAQSVAFVVHQLLKAHLEEPARNPLDSAWNLR